MNILLESEKTTIINSLKHIKNSEYEFSLYNRDNVSKQNIPVSYNNFLNIIKFINSDKKNIIYTQQMLDMFCILPNNNVYRITINDIDNINNIIKSINTNFKNTDILNTLINNSEIKLTLIKKTRKLKINLENYPVTFRHSYELNIDKSELNNRNVDNGGFRLKTRIRYKMYESVNYTIYLDISIIKMNTKLYFIDESPRIYEIEIELEIKKYDNKLITKLEEAIFKILQLLNKNENLLKNKEIDNIITNYCKIMGMGEVNNKLFYSMPMRSLIIQDIIDQKLINYNITDKADGERMLLYIYNNNFYGITKTNDVYKYNFNYNKSNIKKYNNSLIDTEYIYNIEHKTHVLLGFDILLCNGIKCTNKLLLDRLKLLYKLETELFNIETKTSIDSNSDKKSSNEIIINSYINDLNNLISNNKYVFKCKYFINLVEMNQVDVFNNMKLILDIYKNNEKYPYKLDGLVFNSIIDEYSHNIKSLKYINLKWKFEELNSIDFY